MALLTPFRPIAALLLAAGLAWVLVVYMTLGHEALQEATVTAEEDRFWSPGRVAVRLLVVAALVAGIGAALGWAERRKVVALYLRRFQRHTEVLSPRQRGGLGRAVRLVTLQDHRFPPYAVSAAETALSLLIPLALVATVFGVTNAINADALPVVSDDNDALWRSHIVYSHYVAWWALALGLFAVFHRVRLHRRQTLRVTRPEALAAAVARVHRLGSPWRRLGWLGLRSTVVETTDALWKDAVQQLLGSTQVAVVDASEGSASVLWELQQLALHGLPTVLIGTRDGLAATLAGLPAEPWSDTVRQCERLVFDPADAASLRRFRRELTQALQRAARPRSALQRPAGRLRAVATAIGVTALMAATAAVAAAQGVLWQSDRLMELLRMGMPGG